MSKFGTSDEMDRIGFALLVLSVESLVIVMAYLGLRFVWADASENPRPIVRVLVSACLLGSFGWLAFIMFAILMFLSGLFVSPPL